MFTLFPKLPTEIRLKIWSEAATPRVVTIEIISRCLCQRPLLRGHCYHEVSISSKTPIPVTLHVDREARAQCMRSLTWISRSCENCPYRCSNACNGDCSSPLGIPLDLSVDTVFVVEEGSKEELIYRRLALSGHGSLSLFAQTIDKAILNKIKFLAVDYGLKEWHDKSSFGCGWIWRERTRENISDNHFGALKKFKALEELYLMDRYPNYRSGAITIRVDDVIDLENIRVRSLKLFLQEAIEKENEQCDRIERKVPEVRVVHCTGVEATGVIERLRR